MRLKGGATFPLGPLGNIYPRNLTSDPTTGIGRYSDEEIFRMMRHAVKPDGTATLSMLMPFWDMADEDMIDIVSYLRSLTPVKNEVPAYQVGASGSATCRNKNAVADEKFTLPGTAIIGTQVD